MPRSPTCDCPVVSASSIGPEFAIRPRRHDPVCGDCASQCGALANLTMVGALDQNEFCRLAVLELPAVYRLAYHLAPSHHDTDDLVQETYVHALKAWQDFEFREHG